MKKLIQYLLKHKLIIICFAVILLAVISIFFQEIDRSNTIKVNHMNIEKRQGKIAVYITGAVKNEGLYYLEAGVRIQDVIDRAGGILPNADINQLNLAMSVLDGDKIVVPQKQEKLDLQEETNEVEEKVNINTASQEELESLAGIGESTAKKIIEYRKKNSFIEIEDIMKVEGIGQAKFNKIKEDICTD